MIASLQIYVMLFFACDAMRHYKMKKKMIKRATTTTMANDCAFNVMYALK